MMKRLVVAILLVVGTAAAMAQDSVRSSRPKVGVVMGGGGAKGAAHIGVLKYMEEIGIPVDYVTGTSIGSIIGGFYSLGYTADEMAAIISNMDWPMYMSNNIDRQHYPISIRRSKDTYLFSVSFNAGNFRDKASSPFLSSLPSGFISGNSVTNFFSSLSVGYTDSMDFANLPIPFACVATDILSSSSVVMRSGNFPLALRSSMAIPGVFSPVYMDNMVLADGGLKDNFPVELCMNMGADIIIGIDVSDPSASDKKELQSLPQLINQYLYIAMSSGVEEQKPICDIYLHPDITGYSVMSFTPEAIDSLIVRGYDMAKQHEAEFLALRDRLGSAATELRAPKARRFGSDTVIVGEVVYSGVPSEDKTWLMIQDGLYTGRPVTRDDVEKTINTILGTGCYTDVTYVVEEMDTNGSYPRYRIKINLSPAEPHEFALGLRVDSEESTSLLLHLGLNQHRPSGFRLMLDGRVSQNPKLGFDLSYGTRKGGSLALDYIFQNSQFSMGNSYSREYSYLTIEHHNLALMRGKSRSANSRFSYGVEEDVVILDSYLEHSELLMGDIAEIFNSPGYLGLVAKYDFDNFDEGYFPTQGHALKVDARWRLSNSGLYSFMTENRPYYGFGDIRLDYQTAWSMGDRVTLLPQLFNRVMIGQYYDLYSNFVGGVQMSRYMDQQMPFIGFNTAQRVEDWAHVVRLDLRVRTFSNQYLSLIANYLMTADTPKEFFQSGTSYHEVLGFGLRYSLKMPMGGPISLDLHWSTLTHRVGLYFNFGYMF